MTDERFPKSHRLLHSSQFQRVYQRRVRAWDEVLQLRACENEWEHPRLGLAVSKRAGKAVIRNRWKRLIREAFRRHRTELPENIDLVVAPQRGAEPEEQAVARSLVQLAWRAQRKLQRSAR